MADIVTPETRSRMMAGIRGRGNRSTELRLAQLLRAARISGWRRHVPIFLGMQRSGKHARVRPDFVFPSHRVAVFVDGCFWHGCPQHSVSPTSNATFWSSKILANTARDRRVARLLRGRGWRVLRIWEHEMADTDRTLRRLRRALASPGTAGKTAAEASR